MLDDASAASLHGSTTTSKNASHNQKVFGIWSRNSQYSRLNRRASASLPEVAPSGKIPTQAHNLVDSIESMDRLDHAGALGSTKDAKKQWKWASKILRFVSRPTDKRKDDIGARSSVVPEATSPNVVMEQTQSGPMTMNISSPYSDEPRSFTTGEWQASLVTAPRELEAGMSTVNAVGSADAESGITSELLSMRDDKRPHTTALPSELDNDVISRSTKRRDTSISRTMSASEVVSLLLEHDCEDLTKALQMSTFDDHPISHGGFSDIFRGELQGGRHVAVKALRVSAESLADNPNHLRQAARELHTWSKCVHPNVMPLLGLAVFRGRIGMVSPWMWKAKVTEYLGKYHDVNRYSLCLQISEGLSYLHNIGIVHGDLKGANVLVSEKGVPVLIDFGNSILKDQTLKFTQARSTNGMTPRWSAAELLNGSSTHTEASDVYALGMTIYEIMTGMLPYQNLVKDALYYKVVVEKAFPDRPLDIIPTGREDGDKLWGLLTQCWSFHSENRPTAAEVADTMRRLNATKDFSASL